MILLCPIVLGGCSSDDDDWMDLDSKHLVGTWSTGTEGTHKYLKFENDGTGYYACLLYTSPSPRDPKTSRMPSSA